MTLGWPHPDYLLLYLSAPQLQEWVAYYELEPFGEERADLRAGIIAATSANVWRKKGRPALKPRDFMPHFDRHPDEPRQSQAEMKAAVDMFNR